jgi:Protein containing von Willebrand factor type A (vWA) domain
MNTQFPTPEDPATRLTDEMVVFFVRLLRREGLKVSPSEAIDALRTANQINIQNREAFRTALRAALVKREANRPVFETLFEAVFKPENLDPVSDPGHSHDHDSEGGYQLENPEENLVPTFEGEGHSHDPIRMLYQDDEDIGGAFERMTAEAVGDAEVVPVETDGMIADFENDPSFTEQPSPSVNMDREVIEWKERQFEAFDAAETAEMEAVIAHLVQRLKQQVKKRQNDTESGRLNVSQTLRRSARTGFVPFNPVFRSNEAEKPRVVMLCDVSYSVTHASRLMLHFLHALGNHSLIKSHDFVFVKELAEVTDLARRQGIKETTESIFRGDVVDVDDDSDFGHAFEQFHNNHMETLRHEPTVIILGDARNNFNESGAWVLREIRERSQQLVWVNPEERSLWNRGPSIIDEYGRHCDFVEQAATPTELQDVLEAALGRHTDAATPTARSPNP